MKRSTDLYTLIVGRILVMLTSIISIRIVTTLFSPSEVGRLNIILSICWWFNLSLISGVGIYVIRRINEWYNEGRARRYIISFGVYRLIIAILSLLVLIPIQYLFGVGITVKTEWLSMLVAGSILVTGCNTDFITYLNFLGHRLWFVFLSLLTLWLGLGISVFFALKFSVSSEYWLGGQLIGQFMILLFAIVILFKFLKASSDKILIRNNKDFTFQTIFRFAWPLSIGIFFYWCHTQGYRFIFQKIAGIEKLGLFAVGFGIGSSLMILFDILFNQYFHPIFYSEIANSDNQQKTISWNKYASAFYPAIILMAIFIATNGSLIAKILTGEKFHQVGNIVIWGALAESLRMMVATTSIVSQAQLETRPLIFPSITGTVTAIICVFMFARYSPFIGTGFALSFGWLVALIHVCINMRKLLPIQIPWKRSSYSLVLSIPIIIFFTTTKNILGVPTTLQSLIVLGISGLYLLLAQFILARKWLALAVKLPVVDNFEQKIKTIYEKIIPNS